MLSMKYVFVFAIILVIIITLANAVPRGATFDTWTAASIGIMISALGSTAIIFLERKRLGYGWFVKETPAENDREFMSLLNIDKIVPNIDYVIAHSNGRIIGHAFARIRDVPYLIDDLDRDRKLFYVGNFARILSTLSFTFEIIPRIMPVSAESYIKSINKQIEDLRLTISSEGSVANPVREARLKHLEKLSTRLLSGEGARDVGFLAHVMVEGTQEEKVAKQLESNLKTMTSALESGLGVKTERLATHEMLEAVQEFFRASAVVQPNKSCRMLSWDLAYLIPFTRPKMPPAEKLIGGVYMGRTSTDAIVCLDLKKYANPHVAILGKSGFGKSTTVKTFISRMFDLLGTPVIIIDYAGEYSDWVLSRKGIIINMQKDRINPFELGGAMLVDRIRQVVDAFAVTCDFKTINQRNAFAEYVTKVYASKGFKLNDPTTWKLQPPTLEDVIRLMENDLPKLPMLNQLTVQSLISRLQVLASGPFGVFGNSTVSIQNLTQNLTCIDLSRVTSNSLKDLIAWTVLQYLDMMMRLEGIRNNIRLVVVLDEAWKLCQDADSLPVAIIKEGRKFGYSLVVSTQDIIDVAEPILSNAGTVVIHRTEHPRYINFFKRAYDLTDQEVSRIKNLSIGEALIKMSIDSKPFVAKIDMERVLPVQPSNKPQSIEQSPNRIYQMESENIPTASAEQEKVLPPPISDLSEDEKTLLKTIAEEPIYSVNDCYQKAGLDRYRGNKAKEQLLKKGLIEQIILPTFSTAGRKPIALSLTENGIIEANRNKMNVMPALGRKGGLMHKYLIDLISTEFKERGFSVSVEHKIGEGKSVDILVNGKTAIEVETGESDAVANARKNLEKGFDVVIVAKNDAFPKVFSACQQAKLYDKIRIITVSKVPELIGSVQK